jgi:hypothetical protein
LIDPETRRPKIMVSVPMGTGVAYADTVSMSRDVATEPSPRTRRPIAGGALLLSGVTVGFAGFAVLGMGPEDAGLAGVYFLPPMLIAMTAIGALGALIIFGGLDLINGAASMRSVLAAAACLCAGIVAIQLNPVDHPVLAVWGPAWVAVGVWSSATALGRAFAGDIAAFRSRARSDGAEDRSQTVAAGRTSFRQPDGDPASGTMVCPKCHSEYRPGYTTCADDGELLLPCDRV